MVKHGETPLLQWLSWWKPLHFHPRWVCGLSGLEATELLVRLPGGFAMDFTYEIWVIFDGKDGNRNM